jgi:hypothetical protein
MSIVWTQLILTIGSVLCTGIVAYFQYKSKQAVTGIERTTNANAAVGEATLLAATSIAEKVDENTAMTAEVHKTVNGPFAEANRQSDAFAAEVGRVSRGGSPTPHGEPSAENPVTMRDNVPTVEPKP